MNDGKQCGMCQGTGSVDTGGQTPWGSWIDTACPYCDGSGVERVPCPVCGFPGYETEKCDKCAGVIANG